MQVVEITLLNDEKIVGYVIYEKDGNYMLSSRNYNVEAYCFSINKELIKNVEILK